MLNIAKDISEQGYSVFPGFLTEEDRAEFAADLDFLSKKKLFVPAGTGNGDGQKVREDLRRDSIYWFEPSVFNESQKKLWQKVESLRCALNESLYSGLWEFEGHYALYLPGDFYKKHLDRFKTDSSRVISFVLYLNDQWEEKDAGELCLYAEGKPLKISPQGGTLVCFLSGKFEHEVLASNRIRKSFTGWFKKRQSESN